MANTNSIDWESSSSQYGHRDDVAQVGLDITGDLTFEAWVKLESAPAADTDMMILSKYEGSTNNRSYYFSYIDRSGVKKLRLSISDDGSSTESYDLITTLTVGTWTHTAVTWKASTSTAIIYVDTVASSNIVGAKTAIFNGTGEFVVAAFNITSAADAFFDGKMDEVRVWNIVRTGVQIAANWKVQLTGSESNLQGYWRFNNTPNDETANNNNLSYVNSPVYSTDVPFSGVPPQNAPFFASFP